MKRGLVIAVTGLVVMMLGSSVWGTSAELYFSGDKNGTQRVTNVQEGSSVFFVIYDPDENTDCDVRDKFTTDAKLMDPKTGAYVVWDRDTAFDPASPTGDYFEETGADTGLFVSNRAFRLGTRESFALSEPWKHTHVVDRPSSPLRNFLWGSYLFVDRRDESSSYTKAGEPVAGDYAWWIGNRSDNSLVYTGGFVGLADTAFILPSALDGQRTTEAADRWLIGRFENMDTLVGMVQDPNDPGDVAIAMMKIIDTEATISWDSEVYKDGNETATLTIVDLDENLSCSDVEYVPVFIIVNPGSWNPANSSLVDTDQTGDSPNNFCMLKRTGGIAGDDTADTTVPSTIEVYNTRPIRWYNIYNAEKNDEGSLGAQDGRYYIQYPKDDVFGDRVDVYASLFDTVSANGVTAISFYAMETGAATGVFQLNLNSILTDLGFRSLNPRDVLVAYYLDPNDDDDFKLATATLEEHHHSTVAFTDAGRVDQNVYWIGRDAIYLQTIDANANVDSCCPEQVVVHICDPHDEDDGEFWVLDEMSSNSSIFFSRHGMQLLPVWDALGVGLAGRIGGYQLQLDNWELEVFNEDDIYVRYNDVTYVNNDQGMLGLGDVDTFTAYSGPRIARARVSNDVSFDWMSIADTQVYDGSTTTMWFLDRNGKRITGYVASDCVFVEVLDPDQNEAPYRRERIDAYWDGGQNWPFGPQPLNEFGCTWERAQTHPVNALLGDTNIFNDSPDPRDPTDDVGAGTYDVSGGNADGAPRIYVLNPRNGRWAAVDLLETGVGTADYVSVTCIDLMSVYTCVPTLGVLPGDTVVAAYQDPSNHSDVAWISIKVGVGGSGSPASQVSVTRIVNESGNEISEVEENGEIFVMVIDPSHAGSSLIAGALSVNGTTFDLEPLDGGPEDTFISEALRLGCGAGEEIRAVYVDPSDSTDTSSDTVLVVAGALAVERFYAAPTPFAEQTTFGFVGSGTPHLLAVEVYDLSGRRLWASEIADGREIVWNGRDASGALLANGNYVYAIRATDGETSYADTGVVTLLRRE